jgi:SAM-dependent methyltransferase
MSTQAIYDALIGTVQRRASGKIKHLDIGAGRGQLIALLKQRMDAESQACDFHVENFAVQGIPLARVNIDREPLPYPDAAFDVVTCSEVVEHVENPRRLIREAWRVLKPGGVLVMTTPNVLNAVSRVRYLVSGFANLFGPLPAKNDKLYSTGGHITPIPYFYLAHALLDADFGEVDLDVDRTQKSSAVLTVLLSPVIVLGWIRFWAREERKYRTLTPENRAHVARHFSWPVLVGRTVVVSARKLPPE